MTTKPNPWHRNHEIRDAIGRAMYERMQVDPTVHLFGEGAHVKMQFDAPQINRDYPDRVHTLPISEDGNTNFAVGTSLLGVKPVVDIITADFMYRAMDSICNTAAKLNDVRAEGEPARTIVIRGEFLTAGPTTGQRPEALFAHIPGLNVCVPSSPGQAYSLMKEALTAPGVTVFFEDRMVRDTDLTEDDFGDVDLPIGSGVVTHTCPSPKLTVVSYGYLRHVVQAIVVEQFANVVEVVDCPTLHPLPMVTLGASARRTKRLLVAEPDVQFCGVGAEIVAAVAETGVVERVGRVGAPRATLSAASGLAGRTFPTPDDITSAIGRLLNDHTTLR